jgi:hypothetical protein
LIKAGATIIELRRSKAEPRRIAEDTSQAMNSRRTPVPHRVGVTQRLLSGSALPRVSTDPKALSANAFCLLPGVDNRSQRLPVVDIDKKPADTHRYLVVLVGPTNGCLPFHRAVEAGWRNGRIIDLSMGRRPLP